jgi:hypothetical protein
MHNGQLPFKKKKIVVMSCHIILFAAVVRSNKMWWEFILLPRKMLCHMFACL